LDLPQGTSNFPLQKFVGTAVPAPRSQIEVVVCGAHLEGFPLNWQLTERGATLVEKTQSSAQYQLYALPDGKRPAMIRDDEQGKAIAVEVWSMPMEYFGSFVAGIPAPLGIGKVELADGRWLCGFMSEGNAVDGALNITELGGWAAYRNSLT
jgi:allophanate hydrolase